MEKKLLYSDRVLTVKGDERKVRKSFIRIMTALRKDNCLVNYYFTRESSEITITYTDLVLGKVNSLVETELEFLKDTHEVEVEDMISEMNLLPI